jgi:hypothetical protein
MTTSQIDRCCISKLGAAALSLGRGALDVAATTERTLGFVCEWPGRGIAESRAEIDAVSILQAAGRAVTLWSDE